jgi:hypothetical protein
LRKTISAGSFEESVEIREIFLRMQSFVVYSSSFFKNKRVVSTFVSCGWLCTDYGLFKKDDLTKGIIPLHVRSANRTRI